MAVQRKDHTLPSEGGHDPARLSTPIRVPRLTITKLREQFGHCDSVTILDMVAQGILNLRQIRAMI